MNRNKQTQVHAPVLMDRFAFLQTIKKQVNVRFLPKYGAYIDAFKFNRILLKNKIVDTKCFIILY